MGAVRLRVSELRGTLPGMADAADESDSPAAADRAALPESPHLRDLDEGQRHELSVRQHVRVGRELVWIDLDGRVRRELISNLYYVQTGRGVFRVSRLTGEVIEV